MKFNPLRFQPLALTYANCSNPDPVRIMDALKRLEPLMPEGASRSLEYLPEYALKYIERYRDDVLQLEMGWEALYGALAYAWERKDYPTVVSLAAGMARPAGRICSLPEAEHLLQIGIEASRHLGDNEHYVTFLNRLGSLLFTSARYWFGRQVWSVSLHMAASSASTFGLWQPLASFAHIADILGNYNYAKQFVKAILSARRVDEPDSLAVALFVRGFYARLMHELDAAHEDFRYCLQLLTASLPANVSTPDQRLLMVVVQTELARVEGDYARARAGAEAALSLAQVYSDRYTIAALLIDQGLYAHAQGRFADIAPIFLRLRNMAPQMKAPHVYRCCHFLGQFAIEHAQRTRIAPVEPHEAPSTVTMTRHEPLSKREREVLHYAAAGFSNQEIAAQLVIERATVKKHLEHIFVKLDVHNRTSAIARARALKVIV